MLTESLMQANIQIVKSDVPYPTVASLVQDGFAPLMFGVRLYVMATVLVYLQDMQSRRDVSENLVRHETALWWN